MAAPLYLERLIHSATLYLRCCSYNKCLTFPISQTLASCISTSEKSNKGTERRRQICFFQSGLSSKSSSDLLHHQLPRSKTQIMPRTVLIFKDVCLDPSAILSKNMSAPWTLMQTRHYGRKVKPKAPKITYFHYSGDLRTIPEIDKNVLLHPYVDLEDEMDENVKKLSSFGFASVTQQNKHLKQLVEDRVIELFGADSELEQEIAKKTLRIRQMIPYCIRMRVDKGNKIWLLKNIFRRRRLLNQLRQIDHERFEWLLRELKIRYVIPRDKEEFLGWKHNLREGTKAETLAIKRKKLEEFKEKLQAEKEEFLKEKARIVAEIEKDMEYYGLGKEFLDSVLVKEKYQKKYHKILTWDERVKLGMTGKIKDYYG